MANYYSSSLQKGSKGDEVKKWQEFLNTQGYGLSVDGDFGSKTDAATKDYQQKNGLGVDGIVGEKTWGKAGFSNVNTPTAIPTTDTTSYGDTDAGKAAMGTYNDAKTAVGNHEGYTFTDYTKGEDVIAAENAYNAHLATKPGEYTSQWQSQLDDIMNSIKNRGDFSYDFNADALYQQYKDKYIKQAKMASADVMGQASAMTGGYGSSYAQTVGNQAYQQSIGQLNDVIPELYQLAYDKYDREGQELYNQYGMLMDRENTDYGRYMDSVSNYYTELNHLSDRYDSALNFDYGQHMDAESMKQAMNRDEYTRLMDALGIVQGDLHHGEDMFYTNQANKNNAAWMEYQAKESARQQYEDSKKASSGGSGGESLQHVASMSSAEIVETMQSYSLEKDYNGLKAFLEDCLMSGRLTQDQVVAYLTTYGEKEEKIDTTVTPTSPKKKGGGGRVPTTVNLIN